MRDLRSNVRTFSEPIKFKIYEETVVDGVVKNTSEAIYKAYANVMLSRERNSNGTTRNLINSNSLTVTTRINQSYTINPDQTIVEIRDKEYIVKETNSFGVNQELITFYCVLRND